MRRRNGVRGPGRHLAGSLLLVFAASLFPSVFRSLFSPLAPSPASAAGVVVRLPLSYRSWELSDSAASATVTQALTPLTVTVPFSSKVLLIVRSGAQRGTLESDSTLTLSGPNDTRAALVLSLLDGRLVVHGGANAPTGLRELTSDEQAVAGGLAPPFLGFRQRQPGRGFDFGGGISYALPLSGGWSLGLGGGYLYHGSYRPVQGAEEIRPGAEISGSAGLDGVFGPSTRVALDFTRRMYSEDEGAGAVYEEPGTWEGILSLRSGESPWRFESLGYAVRKEEGTGTVVSPFSGWHAGGAATLLRSLGERVRLGATGEAAYFRGELPEGADERPTAHTLGGGPTLRLRLSDSFTTELQGLLLTGDEAGLSLSGWDARLSFQFIAAGSSDGP